MPSYKEKLPKSQNKVVSILLQAINSPNSQILKLIFDKI